MKTILAITTIFILCLVSVVQGVDGALLASGFSIIAGLGGYALGASRK